MTTGTTTALCQECEHRLESHISGTCWHCRAYRLPDAHHRFAPAFVPATDGIPLVEEIK